MEGFFTTEEIILSAVMFSDSYKFGGDGKVLKDFVSAYLELTSLSHEHHSNAFEEFGRYYEAEITNCLINQNEAEEDENEANDHDDPKVSTNAFIRIHSPNRFNASYGIDHKEVISEFKSGSYNRTGIYGDKVMEFSTSEFIQGPNPMTRHVTVSFSRDVVSKPVVEERLEAEDCELYIEGVKPKSQREKSRELMGEILKDIHALDSMDRKKKKEETEDMRRREESIRLLEWIEEIEKQADNESKREDKTNKECEKEEDETDWYEKTKDGTMAIGSANEWKEETEEMEVVYRCNQKSDGNGNDDDDDDDVNDDVNDPNIEVIDMDNASEGDGEFQRVKYEHLLGNRIAEWMHEIVQSLTQTMAENGDYWESLYNAYCATADYVNGYAYDANGYDTHGYDYDTPHGYGYGTPHGYGYDIPHDYGYDIPHDYGYGTPHGYGYDIPHDYSYDIPHGYSYDIPHDYSYDIPHGYGYDIPHDYGYGTPHGYDTPHDYGYGTPHGYDPNAYGTNAYGTNGYETHGYDPNAYGAYAYDGNAYYGNAYDPNIFNDTVGYNVHVYEANAKQNSDHWESLYNAYYATAGYINGYDDTHGCDTPHGYGANGYDPNAYGAYACDVNAYNSNAHDPIAFDDTAGYNLPVYDANAEMRRHVTVFFSGENGVSKPTVEERFEPEDRELCVDGVTQKTKMEENKELMGELLKDIEHLNAVEEKKRREESIKLLEWWEKYPSNTDSTIFSKSVASESLGMGSSLGTGLETGVGLQAEEVQKFLDLHGDYKTMDEGGKENGKEEIRNTKNESEMTKDETECDNEIEEFDNEGANECGEKMSFNQTNAMNAMNAAAAAAADDDDDDDAVTAITAAAASAIICFYKSNSFSSSSYSSKIPIPFFNFILILI